MNLSKSKYCNALQCNKQLWLNTYKPEVKEEVNNESVLDNGTEVGTVAKDLFGNHVDIHFNSDLNIMVEETKKELEKENVVITEASFIYDDCFCSIDLLKKTGNDIEIYEVKSSTEISEIYLEDISYQVYVLTNLGFNITKACIVYINNQYVRNGNLELDKLFNIEDVTDIAKSKHQEVKNNIIEINKYMELVVEPKKDIDIYCQKPYECPFFNYCSRHLPSNNVFKIRNMKINEKYKLYHRGIYSFENLLNEDIDLYYKQQIRHELSNIEAEINIENIKRFMDELTYPLYFLDFETFQQPIPKYDGIRPYMQIPFQYSLHYIESINGELKHKEFLAEAGIDPRRKLAEQLVKDIPLNVCTLAYNMRFEKTVIKNLANMYPDLEEHLMNIYDNMKDLMIPFYNRDYYVKEMQGSYSIKYVSPALYPNEPSLDYHNLDLIHNGSEAMNNFANLELLSQEEQEKIRNSLLEYCELDTYSMVMIWKKLKEIVGKDNI